MKPIYPMQRIDVTCQKMKTLAKNEESLTVWCEPTIQETVAGKEKPMQKKTLEEAMKL